MGSGFSLQAAFRYQNAMLALFLHGKKSLRYSPSPELSENKFQFFFCTRPEILPFCTLDFVVATIVAMAFLRRICSSRPGDGEQRGQSLAALTARGRGLDCLQPQPRQPVLRRNKLRCCPRCWLFSCLGFEFPTPIFLLKSTKRSAAAISRSQRSFITFYGALWNILLSTGFPAMFHMITLEQTFVNGPLQNISLADASESNRFYPCFRESRDVVSADIPVC